MKTPLTVAPLAATLFCCACATTTGEQSDFGRAGLSSDTGTTAYGTFEVEAGFEADPGDRRAIPLTLKFGHSEFTELYMDWSVYEKVALPGDDGEGVGDLGVGVRHRYWEGASGTSAGLQGFIKFPTGDEDEGTSNGKLDFFAASMVTQEFSNLTLNGFFQLGVIGDAIDDDTDVERTIAVSWGAPTGLGLETFGEVSRRFTDDLDPSYLLFGLAFQNSSTTVFDFGVSLGLNSDASEDAFFVGVTTNLGILGPQGPSVYREPGSGY
ncbi:MAG: hypothetical protein P8N31_09795 [Planctomycetota bacterium]|nr:hypothetical protein [Planctomycetota bacterium]MDG2143836.1 hypothetical protein [Planctomycetota bacterium]